MEYSAIKEQIESNSRAVYYSDYKSKDIKDKTMLMVSHTLERGGAPLVLLELVPYFQKEYNVVFVSILDGELREEYLRTGVDVHIGNSVEYASCDTKIWDAFNLVLLNTIVSHIYLPLFINRNVKVLWWLHEPEMLFRNTFNKIIHFALLSENIKILSVTAETAACVKKYYGLESELLHMGLEDKYVGEHEKTDDKIRFFMPAKFQMIKGQDIMAQAIIDLPPIYHDKAEFIFAGARDQGQPEYYDLISKLAVAVKSVRMLGEISKDEVYQWYEKVDCVIAPSRADATPTTIVEGMMFGKLCACSTAAGISRYMTDGEDGFVFPAEDVDALKKMLMHIIDNYYTMDAIRESGRKIFLEHFERTAVEKELEQLIADKAERV